jgi:hypothetical protein
MFFYLLGTVSLSGLPGLLESMKQRTGRSEAIASFFARVVPCMREVLAYDEQRVKIKHGKVFFTLTLSVLGN